MNLKIQCACGAKYSFDVEPVNGRMPFPVQCPSCQADGTEAANQLIAQTAPASRLRINVEHAAGPVSAPPVATAAAEAHCNRHVSNPAADVCVVCQKPICLECMSMFGYLCSIGCRYQAEERGIVVPKYRFQKAAVENREMNKATWLTGGILALVVVFVAGLCGLHWFNDHVRLVYHWNLAAPVQASFFGPGKSLLVNNKKVTLHDLKTQKDVWSTPLTESEEMSTTYPQYYVDKSDIWIVLPHRVVCINGENGEITKTIPFSGEFENFMSAQKSLLLLSSLSNTSRLATRINLPSGEVQARTITIPRSEKHLLPDELPANVAPTAGVLLAQMEEDKKFHREITAVSSEFFSAGENLVELRTTLVEAKVSSVQTMKPKGASHINGNTTVSTSAADVFEETFNDIKRSRTGGFRTVDDSRYEVRLRRWIGEPQPVEWKGEVNGVPAFFPLPTVDLVVAGKQLIVFDKLNNKLFQSQLTYPLSEPFLEGNENRHLLPATQTANALYLFDQGVLTAFDLPGGNVRWRLTSIGIKRVQFDANGAIYVDSTSASPEDIQYPDQIKMERINPVLIKVDAATGKILWQTAKQGEQSFQSGKYLYTTSQDMGGIGLAMALGNALDGRRPSASGFHIYRLDPENGKTIWNYQPAEIPEGVSFQNNQILLNYEKSIELLKFSF